MHLRFSNNSFHFPQKIPRGGKGEKITVAKQGKIGYTKEKWEGGEYAHLTG
jgi:hypothetical protein